MSIGKTGIKKGKKQNKRIIIILLTMVIYTIFLMWITGTAEYYFPDPIYTGFGAFNIAVGIIFFSLFLYSIAFGYLIILMKRNR